MKTKTTLLLVFYLMTNYSIAQNVKIGGYARNYTGLIYENSDFAILQNTFNLDFSTTGNKVGFYANPILYHYNSDSLNLQLRELYLDLYFQNFDIRIGKQQIVWGKADGVFITDVISPLDLSEFLLPDFEEIRIGVNAAKIDYYIGNSIVEFIWLPEFTSTRMPGNSSIWFSQPDFVIDPTFDWSQSDVDFNFENSEFFLKYSALTSAIDFEIMGGYTWDDNPVMHITKEFDYSTGMPVLNNLNVIPQYHRLSLYGGSFSTEVKGLVVRNEFAYYVGKYFQTEDPFAADALVKNDYLHYLIGLDFNIMNIKFSTQFIQEAILNYDNYILNDEFENTFTFLAKYDMFKETLHLELFTYYGLNNNDALIRPKISYDFDDSFSILLGSNIFVGDDQGRFGQYGENSMIYTKFKYSF